MEEVQRARDTHFEHEVAIKVLPEELAEDGERLRRSEREAQIPASSNHPNVVHVYGIDRVEGASFMTMELVPGEDLPRRLSRGALPMGEALDFCRQIAEGLEAAHEAAHEAGVICRDLKPANAILTLEGQAKLGVEEMPADFPEGEKVALACPAGSRSVRSAPANRRS